jgi:hypothetical protein
LTLRPNGTGVFKKNILGLGNKGASSTYKFSFLYYDQHSNLLSKTPILSHEIPEQHTIHESSHAITFNMSDFYKIERVKMSLMCEKEGFNNRSPNNRSLSTAKISTPNGEGNQGRCNAETAAHEGSGAAYAILRSECLDGSQSFVRQSTPSAETRAITAGQPDAPALANGQAHHDEQQRTWDATARRSINSICTGCTGSGRSPSSQSPGAKPKAQRH